MDRSLCLAKGPSTRQLIFTETINFIVLALGPQGILGDLKRYSEIDHIAGSKVEKSGNVTMTAA